MHIFISAGEPSGDLHGANLIRALRRVDPKVRCTGFGGDRMTEAGADLLYPLTRLAVMWFLRAILNIFTFLGLLKRARRFFHEQKPDAVVLIDFPGFNFALAKRAHAEGIPVYWFVPPQLWAWAGWRVKKMKWWVNEILCTLPFEEPWYKKRGVACRFIGHPFFDEVRGQQLDDAFLKEQQEREGRVVALLPGSRLQEVKKNLPSILNAAALVHARQPQTRFLVAAFNETQAEMARTAIVGMNVPIQVHVGRTPEIIELAEACMTVSGSVSLELLARGKPAVVIYKIKWHELKIAKPFIRCRFITLVNLLASEEVYPEYLTDHDPSEKMAEHVVRWLSDPAEMLAIRSKLVELKERVGQPGACERAAAAIVQHFGMPIAEPIKLAA